MQYIVAAANLHGHIYGIAGTRDLAAIREIMQDIVMPSFAPEMEGDETDVEVGISDAGEFWGLLFRCASPVRLGGGAPSLLSPLKMDCFPALLEQAL